MAIAQVHGCTTAEMWTSRIGVPMSGRGAVLAVPALDLRVAHLALQPHPRPLPSSAFTHLLLTGCLLRAWEFGG